MNHKWQRPKDFSQPASKGAWSLLVAMELPKQTKQCSLYLAVDTVLRSCWLRLSENMIIILHAIIKGLGPFNSVLQQTKCILNLGEITAWESSKQQMLYIKNGIPFAFQHVSTLIVRANSALHMALDTNALYLVTSKVLLTVLELCSACSTS